jgi:predicted TIM-barrel fold metal-dependent hydrolase
VEGIPIFDFHARLVPRKDSPERMLRTMDEVGIDRAAVSAGGTIPLELLSRHIIEGGAADVDADNDFVLAACEQSAGRLVPIYFANPYRDAAVYAQRAGAFRGLELAPAVHGVALTDSRTAALIQVAEQVGHSVYLHCLIRPGFTVRDLTGLAERFPRVTFVLAHGGIGHIDLYGVELIAPYQNVLLETSGGYTRVVSSALERLGASRLLFGSEYPIQHPTVELAKYRALQLPPEQWRQIAWHNACRVLALPDTLPQR